MGTERRRIVVVVPVMLLVFSGVAALVAVMAFKNGYFQVTQGPKHGPPHTVWAFQGADATRIGVGAGMLAIAWLMLAVLAVFSRRLQWGKRPRALVRVSLVLHVLAVVLFFPPWRLTLPSITGAYYGFLVPMLAGAAALSRGRAGLWQGALAGLVLSAVAGYGTWLDGLMPAILTALFIGPQVVALGHEPGRAALARAIARERR
jgi:hypothetical protein